MTVHVLKVTVPVLAGDSSDVGRWQFMSWQVTFRCWHVTVQVLAGDIQASAGDSSDVDR